MARDDNRRTATVLLGIFGMLFLFFFAFTFLVVHQVSQLGQVDALSGPGDKVGVVEVKGMLVESKEVLEQLGEFRKNDSVKAIVVRIDSPGGAVGPSQEIYTEIRRINEKKPVIASLGATAASGGYYVAAATRKIVASAGTLTGSIGVITQLASIEGILELLKVKTTTIKAGRYKDMGSPFRELDEEELSLFNALLDDVHEQFIGDIADARGMEADAVRPHADGRVLTGRQAKAVGLVDEIGNFNDAIALAAKEAGIEGEPEVVYPPEEPGEWLRTVMQGSAGAATRGVVESLKDFQGLGSVLSYPGSSAHPALKTKLGAPLPALQGP